MYLILTSSITSKNLLTAFSSGNKTFLTSKSSKRRGGREGGDGIRYVVTKDSPKINSSQDERTSEITNHVRFVHLLFDQLSIIKAKR